jgi:F-type H+-transporting ATPase subunit epsilon
MTAYDNEVLSLSVPGIDGYLEILPHHAPLITSLQPGKVLIIDMNYDRITYEVTGGFLEVSHNQATLLADTLEKV